MIKTGIILLARMGSTRLPGKVMLDLCGKPVLGRVIDRLKNVRAEPLVVATSLNDRDDAIVEYCNRIGADVFRGSEENVLDRCIKAANAFNMDVIVRLGADSPLIDREIINRMLALFFKEHAGGNPLEYVSNSMKRSFPLGLDADVMTRGSLERIDRETRALSKDYRKLIEINVTPYIHENPDTFRTLSYHENFDYSHLRWTLDTPEDFELVQKIYNALHPVKKEFLMEDILALLERNPEWPLINSEVEPRSGFWTRTEKEKLNRRLTE